MVGQLAKYRRSKALKIIKIIENTHRNFNWSFILNLLNFNEDFLIQMNAYRKQNKNITN